MFTRGLECTKGMFLLMRQIKGFTTYGKDETITAVEITKVLTTLKYCQASLPTHVFGAVLLLKSF